MTLPLSSTCLFVQVGDGRGRRDSVQRHIDDGRASTRRGSRRSGLEAFPFSPAWLVQMHVSIDKARQDPFVAHVDYLDVFW